MPSVPKNPNYLKKPYRASNNNNAYAPYEDSEEYFDEMIGEEQMTPQRLDESLQSFGSKAISKPTAYHSTAAELSAISASIQSLAKQKREEQVSPLIDSSFLSLHDVFQTFSVDRFKKHVEDGPRNFYDHIDGIKIRDMFSAQLDFNRSRDISNVADIRAELKIFEEDMNSVRTVGTVSDLNKAAYDVMKKTHERERKESPGNTDLITQHDLERSYFKYRVTLDEKPEHKETIELREREQPKLIQNMSSYLDNNPDFKEVMRIEKSLLEDVRIKKKDTGEEKIVKSSNVSNWKKGLRNFHGEQTTHTEQFDAEKQMLSMQSYNLRNVSPEEKPTLIHHIKTEQAIFAFKKEEFLFSEKPSPMSLDRLNAAKEAMFDTVKSYEKHLSKVDSQKKGFGTVEQVEDDLKPRTVHQVNEELAKARAHYGTVVGKGNTNDMAEAFSNMKNLESEFDKLQKAHQFPIDSEHQELRAGIADLNMNASRRIQQVQTKHRTK